MNGFETDAWTTTWDDEDPVDAETHDGEIHDAAWVSCPYCGEAVELRVDPTGGAQQEYVEDCEICCRPWIVRVAVSGSGHPDVMVSTLDDS